jgi:nucleotide-binding universal stress UspA family protein
MIDASLGALMKILVAIDGSPNSVRALRYAVALAGKMTEATTLLLANVHDDVALRSAAQFVAKESLDTYLDDLGATELEEAIKVAEGSGIHHETRLLRGPIGNTLAQAAASEGCDLMVLGSKGRSALKDLLIGSVAHQVTLASTVPVLLVR